MKTTFQTVMLSALLMPLGASVAHAQGAPAPAPGTPIVSAPATGAPAPDTADAPSDSTQAPSQGKEKKKEAGAGSAQLGGAGASSNPFRLSWFTWNTNASTKIFGVGKDYIGTEDESASMDFSFTPRWAFINNKQDWAWVGLNINWAVELTNSDSTTKLRQPLFGDLGVQSSYSHTFVRTEKGTTLLFGPRLSFTLPTSMASQAANIYTRTSLGLGGTSNIAFHDGDWFNSVFLAFGGTWQHTFSQSQIPYSSAVVDPYRQDFAQDVGPELAQPLQTHYLSGKYLTHDQLSLTAAYYLSIIDNLSFGNSFGLQVPWKYGPATGTCVKVATGTCDTVQSGVGNANPQQNVPNTIFDVSLAYIIGGVVWTTIGYNNTTSQLGEDGTRRNIFYSPDAQFYLSNILMLDAIYSKVTAPKKSSTASARHLFGL
ncbi:MAG: hypothetical protein U0359_27000 [Byssovorax sp.]